MGILDCFCFGDCCFRVRACFTRVFMDGACLDKVFVGGFCWLLVFGIVRVGLGLAALDLGQVCCFCNFRLKDVV